MQHEEINLLMSDNFILYGQAWRPETPAKAAVCLVHGLGEHTGRYEHVARKLTENGYALIGCDLRGHGITRGPRGHYPSFEQVMQDVQSMLDYVRQQYPDKPVFLYGHSMGGCIVLNYGIRMKPEVNGVVATSPGLKTGVPVNPSLLAVGKILYAIVPTFGLNNGLDRNNLSNDPAVIAKYAADPLVHPKISARFALDFINAGQWALDHAAEFSLPLLIQIGEKDHIVSVPAAEEFASKAPNCTYKKWPGLCHETHNEPEQDQVLQNMVNWLDQRL
jgi:acylglycerol lipase